MNKIIWFLVFSTFLNFAYCYDVKTSELDKDVANGKTIAIGKVNEDSRGDRYFVTTRRWTYAPDKIFLEKTYIGGKSHKQGVLGEFYILTAINQTSPNGFLQPGVYKIIPLNTDVAKKLILKLSNVSEVVEEINPSWQFCSKDAECVKLNCKKQVNINLNFKDSFLNLNKNRNEVLCKKDQVITVQSHCKENFCSD